MLSWYVIHAEEDTESLTAWEVRNNFYSNEFTQLDWKAPESTETCFAENPCAQICNFGSIATQCVSTERVVVVAVTQIMRVRFACITFCLLTASRAWTESSCNISYSSFFGQINNSDTSALLCIVQFAFEVFVVYSSVRREFLVQRWTHFNSIQSSIKSEDTTAYTGPLSWFQLHISVQ